MDHLALRSAFTKATPYAAVIEGRRQYRVPAAVISCRGNTGSGDMRERGRTDFYRLLSISSPEKVGSDEIKRAYRSLALRYHPDVCRDESMKEESARMFVKLNEAYKTLSDPVLRSEYDFQLGLSGLGCQECQASSSIENDRSDLERQFERAVWREQGSDEASELRKRNTCRMAKKGQNRMRR